MNDTPRDTTTVDPPPPQQIPPLTRPREGRVIAGVAAGVAERLGVGAGWIRVAFIIACLFGGLGLLLYVVGWLAIPESGEESSIAASRVADLEGGTRWLGVALIVIGGLIVLSWTDAIRGELVWAGALVLVGILLYRGEFPSARSAGDTPPAPPPPPPPPPAPATTSLVDAGEPPEDVVSEGDDGSQTLPPPPPAAPPPPPPPPKRQRSMLGRLTLAAMLIAIGVLALADNAGAVHPEARHYLGTVVAVAGLGLVVGAWAGRARGLIALGILLLPALLVASVVRVPFSGDVGEEYYFPTSAAAVAPTYRLGAGDLLVDLRDVVAEGEIIDFEATVGAGRLRVVVPEEATVYVDGRVGFGELVVFGTSRGGIGREYRTLPPPGSASYFNVRAEAGFGQVEIIRAGSSGAFPLFSERRCETVPTSAFCLDAG